MLELKAKYYDKVISGQTATGLSLFKNKPIYKEFNFIDDLQRKGTMNTFWLILISKYRKKQSDYKPSINY